MAKRGFTFLEVMVTVGLIVVVLTISSVAYRRGARRTEVILFAQQVASDIRQAESSAASGKNRDNLEGTNIWGAHFSVSMPGNYILYAEADGNGYTEGEKFRTAYLSKTVSVGWLGCLNADGSQGEGKDWLDISYTPPDPKVTIKVGKGSNVTVCNNGAYVVLKDQITNSTKEIRANFFGLVDVTR